MKDLYVKSIEETSLSQGKTLTELKKQLESNKDSYEFSRNSTVLSFGITGAITLASIVGGMITQNYNIATLSWFLLAPTSALFGTSSLKWLATDKFNYEKSYKEYYKAVKQNGNIEVKEDAKTLGIRK